MFAQYGNEGGYVQDLTNKIDMIEIEIQDIYGQLYPME
jgi:hypothetical protein